MTIFDWITELGGIDKAAAMLKESPRTVASWYFAEKIPKPHTVQRIIVVSKGKLDWNRVYAPILAKQATKASNNLIKRGDSE
ncbi:hypothetical protein [Aeromonas phage 59.1]|nr:hypothetical protein [Aeromonas phage 59.1]